MFGFPARKKTGLWKHNLFTLLIGASFVFVGIKDSGLDEKLKLKIKHIEAGALLYEEKHAASPPTHEKSPAQKDEKPAPANNSRAKAGAKVAQKESAKPSSDACEDLRNLRSSSGPEQLRGMLNCVEYLAAEGERSTRLKHSTTEK